LEVPDRNEKSLLNSLLPAGAMYYRAPSWLRAKPVDGDLRWRVVMFDQTGQQIGATPWRGFKIGEPGKE
jgi:hypothetical protein